MLFSYLTHKTFEQAIDVVDPGNMCLRCMSAEGEEYYIITKTIYGKVNFLMFGPIIDGYNGIVENYSCTYSKIDYKESKIEHLVGNYINDSRKKILEVVEIQPEEAFPLLPNLAEGWKIL